MKDVAIMALSECDTDGTTLAELARFLELMACWPATAASGLPGERSKIAFFLRAILDSGGEILIIRLYQGEGRICGAIAAEWRQDGVTLHGPVLNIGDWAGHAEALLSSLARCMSERNLQLPESSHVVVPASKENRNLHRFARDHGFTISEL